MDSALIKRVWQVSSGPGQDAVNIRDPRKFRAQYATSRVCDLVRKLEWDKTFNYKNERFRE